MDKLSFLGHVKPIDFNLFGIDLSQVPRWGWNILIIIPIYVYLSSVLSSWLSMRLTKGITAGSDGRRNER